MEPIKLTPAQVVLLRGIAKRVVATDERSPAAAVVCTPEAADAYAVGVSDGEALLARRLLAAAGRA